jgi:hypothetical protein
VVTVAVVAAALVLPAFLPLMPAGRLARSAWAGGAENQLETVGWPQLVDQVTLAYDRLPTHERARTTILTSNYGEAGAIARYGPSHGLPPPYSGHNGYGDWGPPPRQDTSVVAVSEDGPPPLLRSCRRISRVHNGEGVSNEESQRAAIYLCEAPAQGWTAAWPHLEHLSS